MCLCVVVVVSLFRLCHITRVYVGFSFLPVIYTVSLSSQSRLSVVFVPFCMLIYFIYLFLAFYCVFLYFSTPYRHLPWQTAARTAKIMSREMSLFCRCTDKHTWGCRPKRPACQALIKPKLLMETECSAKCWSLQGPRSLGSVELSGSRDSTAGNMPRWNKPIFGAVSLPYLAVFQLYKVRLKQCCWRVMDLKYYSLA